MLKLVREIEPNSNPVGWMELVRGSAAEIADSLTTSTTSPGGYGKEHRVIDVETGEDVTGTWHEDC